MSLVLKVHHSVDAKHVKNLGEQSVSSPVQAINEMVKNSYDADATQCTVHFYAKSSLEQFIDIYKIVVEDDGIGMTFSDIEKKWMRIATDNKERETLSPKFGRRVSGDKGMGHFATQKLGNVIKIISNPEMYESRPSSKYSNKTLVLTTDWKKYQPGKTFEEIDNDLEILERENKDLHGITIEITELAHQWTKDDVENVQLNLGTLQIPKLLRKSKKNPFEPKVVAHGFELPHEEIESSIEKFADYEVRCFLKGSMVSYTIYKKNKKNGEHELAPHINERAGGKGKFPIGSETCGDANFRLLLYQGRVGEWAPDIVKNRKELDDQLKENCGIKIFNDGVRIMPYGEPGNDWLGLGARKVARRADHIRQNQVIGYVFLTRKNNPDIIETTTRQAVVQNKAFEILKNDFVLGAIRELERYLGEEKIDKDFRKVHEDPKTKAASTIKQLTEFVDGLELDPEEKKEKVSSLNALSNLMDKQEKQSEEVVEKITTNLEMYRNLASLGISSLAFHHEIIQPIGRLEARQNKLVEKWDVWDDEKKLDYIRKSLKDIWTVEDLNTYIREFAALFKGAKGTKRGREEINIKKSLERLTEGFESILSAHKIKLIVDEGSGSFSGLFMNMASFESIILNLISNSLRALLKVSRVEKKIKISYEQTSTNLTIRLYDNGYGIHDVNFERIFEPFWTTYKGEFEYGTGMGMTIVRETLEDDYDGTVQVESSTFEEDNPGKGETTILVTIPLENLK